MSLSDQLLALAHQAEMASDAEDTTAMEILEKIGQLVCENIDDVVTALQEQGD